MLHIVKHERTEGQQPISVKEKNRIVNAQAALSTLITTLVTASVWSLVWSLFDEMTSQ